MTTNDEETENRKAWRCSPCMDRSSSSLGSDDGSISVRRRETFLALFAWSGDESAISLDPFGFEGPAMHATSESELWETSLCLRFRPFWTGVRNRCGVLLLFEFCPDFAFGRSSRERRRTFDLRDSLMNELTTNMWVISYRAAFQAETTSSRAGFTLKWASVADFRQRGHSGSLTMCSRMH